MGIQVGVMGGVVRESGRVRGVVRESGRVVGVVRESGRVRGVVRGREVLCGSMLEEWWETGRVFMCAMVRGCACTCCMSCLAWLMPSAHD